jgi:hypothetical protein
MSAADTLYTARFLSPEILERGRANTITCPVYRLGTLVAPNSGTVSIYKADQTAIVSAAAVTISGSVAQYATSTLSSYQYEEGWLVEWALAMPDGVTHTFRRDAVLARRRLYPVVTDADLLRRHSDLTQLRASGVTSYQDYIDEAWAIIENRLVTSGRRPWLVMSASSLRDAHMALTLHLIWLDYATSAGDTSRYQQLADHYGRGYEEAWSRLTFSYDETDENKVDVRRASGAPTLWLCGRGGINYPPYITRRIV